MGVSRRETSSTLSIVAVKDGKIVSNKMANPSPPRSVLRMDSTEPQKGSEMPLFAGSRKVWIMAYEWLTRSESPVLEVWLESPAMQRFTITKLPTDQVVSCGRLSTFRMLFMEDSKP